MSTPSRATPQQPAPKPIGERLRTTKEAAERIGVTENYLIDDRRGPRRIPFVRLSRKVVRYRDCDLDAAAEAHLISKDAAGES